MIPLEEIRRECVRKDTPNTAYDLISALVTHVMGVQEDVKALARKTSIRTLNARLDDLRNRKYVPYCPDCGTRHLPGMNTLCSDCTWRGRRDNIVNQITNFLHTCAESNPESSVLHAVEIDEGKTISWLQATSAGILSLAVEHGVLPDWRSDDSD